jgi:hypothetical protein
MTIRTTLITGLAFLVLAPITAIADGGNLTNGPNIPGVPSGPKSSTNEESSCSKERTNEKSNEAPSGGDEEELEKDCEEIDIGRAPLPDSKKSIFGLPKKNKKKPSKT